MRWPLRTKRVLTTPTATESDRRATYRNRAQRTTQNASETKSGPFHDPKVKTTQESHTAEAIGRHIAIRVRVGAGGESTLLGPENSVRYARLRAR